MCSVQYVIDLSDDDEIDTVRFQLSTHVRARYGAPPTSALYHDSIPRGPLSITVDIEMPGDILDVTSWNHNPLVDIPTPHAGRAGRVVRKQFDAADFDYAQDVLLTVHALGLGRPRCFVEQLSHEENALRSVVGPTTAFALTVVPRFDIKVRLAQEYIFLIDRSGSMTGSNIEMAKQALELLMNQLPPTNSMFNIYSFGSSFHAMWSESQPYTQATLFQAV
jgi:von Willebrand factor type A domain